MAAFKDSSLSMSSVRNHVVSCLETCVPSQARRATAPQATGPTRPQKIHSSTTRQDKWKLFPLSKPFCNDNDMDGLPLATTSPHKHIFSKSHSHPPKADFSGEGATIAPWAVHVLHEPRWTNRDTVQQPMRLRPTYAPIMRIDSNLSIQLLRLRACCRPCSPRCQLQISPSTAPSLGETEDHECKVPDTCQLQNSHIMPPRRLEHPKEAQPLDARRHSSDRCIPIHVGIPGGCSPTFYGLLDSSVSTLVDIPKALEDLEHLDSDPKLQQAT